MRRIAVLALALALPIGTAACGDDNGTGPDDGLATATFTASVSGDLSSEFQGQAFFGEATDPETGDDYWVLILTTGSQNSGQTVYFGRRGARPGNGTSNLTDIEDSDLDVEAGQIFALYLDFTSQQSYGVFASSGGTLTVSESSGSKMTGTFSIQATGTSVQGQTPVEVNVTITGEFNAQNGNVGFPGVL
jgi:hypothetical protein